MRFSIPFIFLMSYTIPALTAIFVVDGLGYRISETGVFVILSSGLAAVIGYGLFAFIPNHRASKVVQKPIRSYYKIGCILLIIGLIAVFMDFIKIGTIPLLFDSASRLGLQLNIWWNLYILCSIGLYLLSWCSQHHYSNKWGRMLIFMYLLSALLTGWKGTLLNFLFLLFLPKYWKFPVPYKILLITFVILSTIFTLVNALRSGGISSALSHPIYYIYWGFVNFDAEAINAVSECYHSIPLLGCQFGVDNNFLINRTWNVFTALTPLYVDGGLPLVIIVFFLMGCALGYLPKYCDHLVGGYLLYMTCYFFFFSHNGYLFYSKSYIVSLSLLILISILPQRVSRTGQKRHV